MAREWISVFVLGVLFASATRAGVVYVSQSAPGPAHDGTSWATAFTIVPAGITAARAGDEVWVAAGTYRGGLTLNDEPMYGGFAGTEMARAQRNPAVNATIIDGAGISSVVKSDLPRQHVFSGFFVQGGGTGIELDGENTVTHCTVTGCSRGVLMSGTAVISNCTISGNTYGLVTEKTEADISGCTIAGNSVAGLSLRSKTATLTNCIVAFNGAGVQGLPEDAGASLVAFSNNDVYGNTSYNFKDVTDPTGTNGNIKQDPLFLDRANGNYRLQASSPCIDTGDGGGVRDGDTDLDGRSRRQGPRVDMGAYEHAIVIPFTYIDVADALRFAGGFWASNPPNLIVFDVVTDGDSAGCIDFLDAVRMARKVAGLEPNP